MTENAQETVINLLLSIDSRLATIAARLPAPAADPPPPATAADAANWWARNMLRPRSELPAWWQEAREQAREYCGR